MISFKTDSHSYLSPSLIQLPSELSLFILRGLPIQDLIATRSSCDHFYTFIDTTPELQVEIAHHYLQKVACKCNIPLNDLKFALASDRLIVEVNNNLCLWKLTQNTSSLPQLHRTIPWISHLIINNGKPKELTKLFTHLYQSKQLVALYLLNCEVDSEALRALQYLHDLTADNQRPPIFHLSNLTPMNCTLPAPFLNLAQESIDPSQANGCSFERLLTQDSDLVALKDLDQQVQNESSSKELVLQKMEALKPAIKAAIISSIWYSTLMPNTRNTFDSSINLIQRQVVVFITQWPHHPAVRAAIRNNLIFFLAQRT